MSPRSGRRRSMTVGASALVIAILTAAWFVVARPGSSSSRPSAAQSSEPPVAAAVPGIPFLGPLFSGTVRDDHFCTASVVHSPAHDVAVTAAHCLSGSAAGILFAPGYTDGTAPRGTWTVTSAYVDATWLHDQNPKADYAFVVLRPTAGTSASGPVEDVVGGQDVAATPTAGTAVRVDGYAAGQDDRPLSCVNVLRYLGGYPTFDCGGYVGGVSGGPWIVGSSAPGDVGTVVAVTGGLHQGGCVDTVSHASAFTATTLATYRRAEAHASPDLLPDPGDDDC